MCSGSSVPNPFGGSCTVSCTISLHSSPRHASPSPDREQRVLQECPSAPALSGEGFADAWTLWVPHILLLKWIFAFRSVVWLPAPCYQFSAQLALYIFGGRPGCLLAICSMFIHQDANCHKALTCIYLRCVLELNEYSIFIGFT